MCSTRFPRARRSSSTLTSTSATNWRARAPRDSRKAYVGRSASTHTCAKLCLVWLMIFVFVFPQYHLERVLMSLARDDTNKCDVDALMVAFSMAVKGGTDDRLKCLFNLAADTPEHPPSTTASSDESDNDQDEKQITKQEFERMLGTLLTLACFGLEGFSLTLWWGLAV